MTTQPQPELQMHWTLVRGCLRMVWTAPLPRPFAVSLPEQPVPQFEKAA